MMGGNCLNPGWRKVKFGGVVRQSKVRCADPLTEDIDRFVGMSSNRELRDFRCGYNTANHCHGHILVHQHRRNEKTARRRFGRKQK
jgi:hypothetical protein